MKRLFALVCDGLFSRFAAPPNSGLHKNTSSKINCLILVDNVLTGVFIDKCFNEGPVVDFRRNYTNFMELTPKENLLRIGT